MSPRAATPEKGGLVTHRHNTRRRETFKNLANLLTTVHVVGKLRARLGRKKSDQQVDQVEEGDSADRVLPDDGGWVIRNIIWFVVSVLSMSLVAFGKHRLDSHRQNIPAPQPLNNLSVLETGYVEAIIDDELNKMKAKWQEENLGLLKSLDSRLETLGEKIQGLQQVYDIDKEDGFDAQSRSAMKHFQALLEKQKDNLLMESKLEEATHSNCKNSGEADVEIIQVTEEMKKEISDLSSLLSGIETETKDFIKLETERGRNTDQSLQRLRSSMTQQERKPAPANTRGANPNPMDCVTTENAQDLIAQRLAIFAADRIAIPDYALRTVGGSIETRKGLTSPSFQAPGSFYFLNGLTKPPETVIESDITIGNCWACSLGNCNITIRLHTLLHVDSVSVDHISPLIAQDIRSAPKKIKVFGFRRLPNSLDDEMDYTHIGDVHYDIDIGEEVQTFDVDSRYSLEYIKFQVLENHGHPDFTCIYRLRVHGKDL